MNDLTRQQLCAALGISESTVRRLELNGLPCEGKGSPLIASQSLANA